MGFVVTLRDKSGRPRRSRWSLKRLIHGMRFAWREFLAGLAVHFPPDAPEPSPPLAKAQALREGALLSEHVDAVSKKSVA